MTQKIKARLEKFKKYSIWCDHYTQCEYIVLDNNGFRLLVCAKEYPNRTMAWSISMCDKDYKIGDLTLLERELYG